jgi:hypothetical protein
MASAARALVTLTLLLVGVAARMHKLLKQSKMSMYNQWLMSCYHKRCLAMGEYLLYEKFPFNIQHNYITLLIVVAVPHPLAAQTMIIIVIQGRPLLTHCIVLMLSTIAISALQAWCWL